MHKRGTLVEDKTHKILRDFEIKQITSSNQKTKSKCNKQETHKSISRLDLIKGKRKKSRNIFYLPAS